MGEFRFLMSFIEDIQARFGQKPELTNINLLK